MIGDRCEGESLTQEESMLYGKNNGETMKTPISGVLKENFPQPSPHETIPLIWIERILAQESISCQP
jgi:hypothetical protein